MAVQNQTPNMDQFEAYFRRADLDQDGRISGPEAVAFFKGSNLPQPVLAQIWTYADQSRSGFLGRQEFYNALKLVTVAQKRELTPEIVKAALFTPASAKIPPPQINLAAIPGPLPANKVGADVPPKQVQTSVVGGPQGLPVQQSHFMRPPRPSNPSPGFQSQQIVSGQVAVGSRAPAPSPQQSHQVATSSVQPGLSKSNEGLDGKVPVTGNGFTSDPLFGDVFSVASVQPKQNLAPTVSSASRSVAVSSAADPLKTSSVNSQTTLHQQPVHHRPNQQIPVQNSVANPRNSLPGQSQLTWPRMTQSDYQKYSKVFMAVDTDRDGKISGAEARNLFLSWKLPREVLKQVWDLSDQDNDSMLSLREFCVALYLMERHREGRPLPSVLPANLIFDESLSPASGQPTGSHGATAWRHTPGPQQTQGQGPRGARQVAPGAPGRPPRPVPIPQPDEDVQPTKQKPKVPVLEKHLVDQLSTEEQGALNTKFQEATDAEKKVMELEKEILEAKEKIQFYHAKMQEIILYKSRCDNRLNEISERTSADKREVELLAKKYEEKYKQTGDVASKLTIEEATFRDIQDKKMELYRTIVKLDQDGKSDGIQDRANQIQADLEGLVKSLNDRCKTYGLRAKPTTLLELPFGWQPGIQEGAADWDGELDKFDNEEFTFVKELTLDVENVIAPSKPKSLLVREKASTSLNDHDTRKSSAEADAEKLSSPVKSADTETAHAPRSPTDSPTRSNNAVESPSKEFEEARNRKDATFDGSPHAAYSEHWGTESVFSGDKNFDESDWPSFDTPLDADAAWDLNSASKDSRNEEHNGTHLFGDDDWNLRPIKTGPTNSSSTLPKQTPLFDSVPSTPSYPSGFSYSDNNQLPKQSSFFDSSVPSTPSYNSGFGYSDNNQFPKQTSFFDSSVPSTPSYTSGFGYSDNNQFPKQSSFFDSSVPSTPAYNAGGESPAFQNKSPFAFADSVPSTPMSGNNFSKFDSFNMPDSGGPFGSHEFSRFDSMRSTRDSEYDSGGGRDSSFARFDSFRSTADSDYNFGLPPRETLSRFDSMRSTTDYGHGFSSFDDADPLGSHDPFKTSTENRTPKKDSDNWKAF